MTTSREYQLRHQINKRAWDEAQDLARFHFDLRRSELLADAGLAPLRVKRRLRRADDERNKRFHKFVLSLLEDDTLALNNDDFLDIIEQFLADPTTTNRVLLIAALRQNPKWLGERLADFIKLT